MKRRAEVGAGFNGNGDFKKSKRVFLGAHLGMDATSYIMFLVASRL